jgi:CutA1 divalent ion tolerance protein
MGGADRGDSEARAFLRSRTPHVDAIVRIVRVHHRYPVPCVAVVPIIDGDPVYPGLDVRVHSARPPGLTAIPIGEPSCSGITGPFLGGRRARPGSNLIATQRHTVDVTVRPYGTDGLIQVRT